MELAEEEPISGLQEMRRGALMAHERETLQERMQRYFDKDVNWTTFAADGTALSKNAGRFDPVSTRARLQGSEAYDDARLRRYALYPFDNRWCYYSSVRPLWNEPRPELVSQRADAGPFLIVRRFAERPKEGSPAFFTSALPDYHLLRPNAVAIPLRLSSAPAEVSAQSTGQGSIFEHFQDTKHTSANLSKTARSYLATLTKLNPDQNEEMSRAVWFHTLAILYAPQYLSEHAASLRADWPRIPLPASLSALQPSAKLGANLAQLLDVEKPVLGVTSGKLRKELSTLGRITGPKGLSLEVSAGWGHIQKEKDIVMPGRGLEKEREFSAEEKASIVEGAAEFGISTGDALALWGEKTLDIYLNNETHWSNVPQAVWDYTIGGYQVLKKWLSYREREVLGREITKEEAREFTHIVRRIAALVLLEPSLDENYLALRGSFYGWPKPALAPK